MRSAQPTGMALVWLGGAGVSVRGVGDIGSEVARRLFIAGYAVVGGNTLEQTPRLGRRLGCL